MAKPHHSLASSTVYLNTTSPGKRCRATSSLNSVQSRFIKASCRLPPPLPCYGVRSLFHATSIQRNRSRLIKTAFSPQAPGRSSQSTKAIFASSQGGVKPGGDGGG
ncbi:hypothetical protein OIU74_002613 [Salix koriyanagi]|uniref:Uncharacterized protein n=1 Tax=Salix koriyanagi TaxID=2511006 RepID=A0A9Q0X4L2_9ROSI|nr:hypothetical protein OIU74_002613 [Salix koriyanagi]